MSSANSQQARFNMIEQQIRTAQVLDAKVLDMLGQIPREVFVPEEYADLAFSDTHIPLAGGQVMMKPIQEGRMLQALNIQKQDKILEIGTGSGYITAMLSQLGKHVVSVEINEELHNQAKQSLASQHITNVSLECGDAAKGWESQGPYDVIAITGSMPILADELKLQLNIGGRMYVILGKAPVMTATLITRISEGHWTDVPVYETDLPALENVEQPPAFVF